jgi:hypothetical protein
MCWMTEESWFDSDGVKNASFIQNVETEFDSYLPLSQWIKAALSPVLQQPDRVAGR